MQYAPPLHRGVTSVRRVRRLLDDSGSSLVGRRVLALCSGGADSVALVVLLASLPRGAAPAALDVLFLDHGLRADVGDELACARAVAELVGAEFHQRHRGADARHRGGGAEGAARAWRLRTAAAEARANRCDVVVTGHTADDQLELALLALLGTTGRPGDVDAMPVARPLPPGVSLVRPLLSLDRTATEDACRAAGARWATDPTNLDPDAHRRNAIRHRVVPELLSIAPGAGAAIARAAGRRRASGDAVRGLADALLATWGDGEGVLDLRGTATLEAGARRELLARWLVRCGLGRLVSERIVRAVDRLASESAGRLAHARVDLGAGRCVRRDGYHLRIQHTFDTEAPRP